MGVNHRVPRVWTKTFATPRRPFEKARLDQELKLVGEFALRNKRELWAVKLLLARIRKAARELLTLDEKDPRRLFQGNALLRRLVRTGVLDEQRMKLLCAGVEAGRFLGKEAPDCSVQAWTCQELPSRWSPN